VKKVVLLYPKLSYVIVGICYSAHNELGRFAREKQYGDFIVKQLKHNKITFKRELVVSDSGNKLDFLVDDKVVLELKVKGVITKNDYYQVQRYLQHSGVKLGILVNFRNKNLRPKRILKTTKDIT